jgi:hypothetical protein
MSLRILNVACEALGLALIAHAIVLRNSVWRHFAEIEPIFLNLVG